MSQRMLIDARHPEETRVAVVNGTRIEEFDFEAADRKQLKGNIYLAKVARVEPSLQAAFIDYGGNRHGFLAFSEIHPDYYQIPREDREALLREEAELAAEEHHDDHEVDENGPNGDGEIHTTGGHDDAGSDVLRRQRQALRRKYKIQEVIRRRQVILVQVVKEERGNKGAALTTYLSLAGRFSVLMPNTAHGGGISRKISNLADRKRLKAVMAELQLPAGMGAIVRTAGLKRSRTEIKRDFDYLTRLWDEIRDTTLASVAPCLVHQDSDLIKRAIRDIYSREIEQVLVDGEAGYAAARDFMALLMPTHAAKVVHYTDAVPLFQRFGVETALAGMYNPVVQLKSGGYIVINPTEALVSIDVNSGRSTREHGIEETAYKTNLEAADEIGRQLRLRDMAGLVVVDFIDMDVGGNNRRVEKAMKEAMRHDRARIQLGRISSFGLMEMSRQRLRTGVLEASTHVCPMCDGSGYVRSVGSAALAALRSLEAEALKGKNSEFQLRAGLEVAMYILNRKRADMVELEERYGVDIETIPDETLMGPNFVLDAAGPPPANPVVLTPLPPPVMIADDDELPVEDLADADGDEVEAEPRAERDGDRDESRGDRADRGRRRRRRRGRRDDPAAGPTDDGSAAAGSDDGAEAGADDDIGDAPAAGSGDAAGARDAEPRRRRRGRRGGRRREGAVVTDSEAGVFGSDADGVDPTDTTAPAPAAAGDEGTPASPVTATADAVVADAVPAKRPRKSRAKVTDAPAAAMPDAGEPDAAATAAEPPAAAAKPRRSRRKVDPAGEPDAATAAPASPDLPPAAVVPSAAPQVPAASAPPPADAAANDAAPPPPRKAGWWQRTFGG